VNLSGGAVMSGRDIHGITVAGLGIVADGDIRWVALSGGTLNATRDARGALVGLYRVKSPRVSGVALSAVNLRTAELRGISVAGHNDVRVQRGLTIGVYNDARQLHGVQLGLINRVRNNPAWARWLPLVNARF
jgi:hypothetical protein